MAIGTPVLIDDISLAGPLTSGALTVPAGGVPSGAQINIMTATIEAVTGLAVTDTAGNTYTEDLADTVHATGNIESHFFRVTNATALVSGNSITVSWTNNSGVAAIAWYTTGLATTTPLDQAVIAEGSSTTPSSGNITTTNNDDIELGVVGVNDATPPAFTEDANFTSIGNTTGGASNFNIYAAYRIVAATETMDYSPTFDTESQNWHCLIASYKAAAGGLAAVSATTGHTVSGGALTQANILTAVAATQGHTVAAGRLVQAYTLIGVSGTQGHTVAPGRLVQGLTLRLANAIAGHEASASFVSTGLTLAIANSITGHTADVGVLQVFLPGQTTPGRIYAVIEDGRIFEVAARGNDFAIVQELRLHDIPASNATVH